jgi:general secretion pathway protein I
MSPALRARGFTLVEVLVALVIVAFGMGALMATLTSAADSVGHLRDKSFAEWIALNRISEMRLRGAPPNEGKTNGVVEYAGARWRWSQEVEKTSLGNMYRIDVSVARADGPEDKAQPQLALASGFFGASLIPTDGKTPDWSGQSYAAAAAGQPGGGGAGTPGAPGTPGTPATPAPTVPPLSNPQSIQ